MRFNLIGLLKISDPQKARQMLYDLPQIIPGAKIEFELDTLRDAEVVSLANKVIFQLSQIPIFDNPENPKS